MEWVCVVLIIGTMLYIGGIVVDYLNHDAHVRPQVVKLRRLSVELAEIAEGETKTCNLARSGKFPGSI